MTLGKLSYQHQPIAISVETVDEELRITYHEANLEEVGGHTHEDVDFAEKVEIEGAHSIVVGHPREEVHQDELTVPLSAISRFLLSRSFSLSSALDDNDGRGSASRDGYKND
jgi:hypothetical protein